MSDSERKLFISTLQNFTKAISNVSNSNVSTSTNKTLELEVRYYALAGRQLEKVDYAVFHRVLNYYKKLVPMTETETTDVLYSTSALTTRHTISNNRSDNVWSTKKRLKEEIDDRFSIKFSLSQEEILKTEPNTSSLSSTPFERKKHRYSFDLGVATLDLTITTNTQNTPSKNTNNVKNSVKPEYEIELEMNQHKVEKMIESFQSFCDMAQSVWKVVNDSDTLYTLAERKMFVSYINQCIAGKENKYGSVHRIQPQARNLKRRDMVDGGLCLGSINYSVTDKADGERCFVAFSPWGILVSKSKTINLLYPYNSGTERSMKAMKTAYTGYVFDAEITTFIDPSVPETDPNFEKKREKRVILAFDTVSIPIPNSNIGSLEIQNRPHDYRLDSLKIFFRNIWKLEFMDKVLEAKNTVFTVKDFLAFITPDEFYHAMKEMVVLAHGRNYKTDGFIFTPIQSPYLLFIEDEDGSRLPIDKLPLQSRVLTEYPDICKLKPVEELTIDFTYDPADKTLYSFDPVEKNLIEFQGSDLQPYPAKTEQPYNNSSIDLTNIGSVNTSAIIEFMYNKAKNQFSAVRLRGDKPVPNAIEIAIDVWNDIFSPLEIQTCIGHDTVLMTEYHKREINKYLEAIYAKGGTLLDYGVSSLARLETSKVKVIKAYHPSHNSENSLKKKKSGKTGSKADFAFVYSYDFTKAAQKQLFDEIFQSISENGIIFYISVNSEVVKEMLKLMNTNSIKLYDYGSLSTLVEKKKGKSFENVFFSYTPNSTQNKDSEPINIKGEGYSIDEIIDIFDTHGFKLAVGHQLKNEKFMNPLEFVLSSCFSLLIFKNNKVAKPYQPLSPSVKRISKLAIEESLQPNIPLRHSPKSTPRSTPRSSIRISSPIMEEPSIDNVEPSIVPDLEPEDDPKEEGIEYEEDVSSSSTNSRMRYGQYKPMLVQEDTIDDISPLWFQDSPVVRIGTIGDGSCLIHSILKAVLPEYNSVNIGSQPVDQKDQPQQLFRAKVNNKDTAIVIVDKKELVRSFRYGAADNLMQMYNAEGKAKFAEYDRKKKKELVAEASKKYPKIRPSAFHLLNKEKIIVYFLLLEDSVFYHYYGALYEEYLKMDLALKNELPYTPTLQGLTDLLKSQAFLGDESYGYLSSVLQTDFIVLRATHDNLLFHDTTMTKNSKNKVVVINGTGIHYELIGVVDENLAIQTSFAYNDPFITAIRAEFLNKQE